MSQASAPPYPDAPPEYTPYPSAAPAQPPYPPQQQYPQTQQPYPQTQQPYPQTQQPYPYQGGGAYGQQPMTGQYQASAQPIIIQAPQRTLVCLLLILF